MSSPAILSVGKSLTLLETRNLILRAGGYRVESARSVNQAIGLCLACDFDVIIMCHSISAKEREGLACWIRASGSVTPVVSVSRSFCQGDSFADANLRHEPESFLSGIKEVLREAGRRSSRTASPRDPRGPNGDKWGKTILCVDDDPNLLVLRRHLLEKAGYCVLTANSGRNGLKVFSTGMVDAVVLDYAMPLMNGGTVAAQMRQIKKDVPLILVSGNAVIPPEDLALFDRSITKAAPPAVLLSTIKKILSAANGQKMVAGSARRRRTYRFPQAPM